MEKKRLNYADMSKGIAILAVVFYHLTAPCLLKTAVTRICDCLLASFFFYSGFFYRPGRKNFGENLKSRVKALMIPFLKYSLFFWCVGTIVLVAKKEETIPEAFFCLRNFFAGCIWNRTIQDWFGWEYYSLGKRYMFLADFWFLIALMLASILFFPVTDNVLKSKARSLTAVVLLLAVTGVFRSFGISLPYNIQLIPFWMALMLLGAFAGNNKIFDIPSLSGSKELLCGAASLTAGILISAFKAPNVKYIPRKL